MPCVISFGVALLIKPEMFNFHYTSTLFISLIICIKSYSQNHFIFDNIPEPKYSNVSKNMKSDIFPVGSKMLFRQNCTDKLDTIVVNGEIIFENSVIYGIRCYQSFILKDTIMVYQYIAPQKTKDAKLFLNIISQKLNLNTEPSFAHKRKEEVSIFYWQLFDNKKINYVLTKKRNKINLEIYYLYKIN